MVEDTRLGVPTGEVPVAEALGAAVVEVTHLEVVAGALTHHFPIRSIQDRNTAAQVIDTLDQGDTMISANPTEWTLAIHQDATVVTDLPTARDLETRPLVHVTIVLMVGMGRVQVDMIQAIQIAEAFQVTDILHRFHEEMNFVDRLVLQEEDTEDVSVLEAHGA